VVGSTPPRVIVERRWWLLAKSRRVCMAFEDGVRRVGSLRVYCRGRFASSAVVNHPRRSLTVAQEKHGCHRWLPPHELAPLPHDLVGLELGQLNERAHGTSHMGYFCPSDIAKFVVAVVPGCLWRRWCAQAC